MRYLSKRLPSGQPARWCAPNDSVAASLAFAGGWAIFGDGSAFIGSRNIHHRVDYQGGLLANSSRFGRCLYTGAQYGTRYTRSLETYTPITHLYGTSQYTAVLHAVWEDITSQQGYSNSISPLVFEGDADNASLSVGLSWSAGSNWQTQVSTGFTNSWNPRGGYIDLPDGFEGLVIFTYDGANGFEAFCDNVPVTFNQTGFGVTTLYSYRQVTPQMSGLLSQGSYTRQQGNFAAIFGRKWSRAEIAAFTRNPWQVFA